MQDYNFWADLLATFRASPDFIKALWLIVPPGFLLGVMGFVAWVLRWRSMVWRKRPTLHSGKVYRLEHPDFETLPIGKNDELPALPPSLQLTKPSLPLPKR